MGSTVLCLPEILNPQNQAYEEQEGGNLWVTSLLVFMTVAPECFPATLAPSRCAQGLEKKLGPLLRTL